MGECVMDTGWKGGIFVSAVTALCGGDGWICGFPHAPYIYHDLKKGIYKFGTTMVRIYCSLP